MAPSRNDHAAAPSSPQRAAETLVTAPRRFGADSRMVLMAGVAGACLLGASAGAWVRPEAADLKARVPAHTPQRAAVVMTQAPQMQIVMDQGPILPHRPPMEVLPDRILLPPAALSVRLSQVEAKDEPVAPKADKPAAMVTPAQTEKPKAAKPKKVEIAKAVTEAPKPSKTRPGNVALAKLDKPQAAAKERPVALAKARPKPAPPMVKPPPRLAEAQAPVKLAKATAKATAEIPPQPAQRVENRWAAEDRRLERAYRRAAEAGVPEWRLARQQARWRQARDAAAREAPWEVPRVYDARIAELDDLAGEAAIEWE